MVVVAVAVTYFTAGALSGLAAGLGPIGSGMVVGAISGAAGAAASQVAGNITGNLDGFSFKDIAIGAISGAVTGGFAKGLKAGSFKKLGDAISSSPAATGAATAVVGNLAGQAARRIAGMETSFSWKSIAASAVGGAISGQLLSKMGFEVSDGGPEGAGSFGSNFANSAVGGVVSLHTRRAFGFDDKVDYRSIAVDAFGTALGTKLGGAALARHDGAKAHKKVGESASERAGTQIDAELRAEIALLMELNRDQPLLAANGEPYDIDSPWGRWQQEMREFARSANPFTSGESNPETFGQMLGRRGREWMKDDTDYGLRSLLAYEVQRDALDTKLDRAMIGALLADPETRDVGSALLNAAGLSMIIDSSPGILKDAPEFAELYRAFQSDLMSSASYQNLEDGSAVSGHWKSALAHVGIDYVSRSEARSRFGIAASRFADERSGYYSALFRFSGSSDYVLANRGTEINSLRDLATDIYGGMGYVPKQFEQAVDLAKQLNNAVGRSGGSLSFTGHSLGGGLASAQSMTTGGRGYTFNSMGLPPRVIAELKLNPAFESRVTSYNISSDQLSMGQGDWRIKAGLVSADVAVGLKTKLFVAGGYDGVAFDVLRPSESLRLIADLGTGGLVSGPAVTYPAVGSRIEIQAPGGHGNAHVLNALFGRAVNVFNGYRWSR
jgi:hypothetical protein